jgi:hypothetical protein
MIHTFQVGYFICTIAAPFVTEMQYGMHAEKNENLSSGPFDICSMNATNGNYSRNFLN